MYSILFRTLILYVLITAVIRAMGKRQVGELETSELVTTLLLSQIASLPIEDPSIPLSHVLLPVLLIATFEIITTFLKGRINPLKRIFESKPSILIFRGEIDQAELLRMRLTVEELLSEVRRQGYRTIREVYLAVLEENGQFSMLPRTGAAPPSADDLGLTLPESGCALPVICDGVTNTDILHRMGQSEGWLADELRRRGLDRKDVFLMTLDDAGDVHIIRKERGK